ncbi:WW domain-containing protein [Aspergillus alliaceus]|uniref:WW domain-containing protein n=1 Tax=Petromyces alliaceus TaxID=209559 RepID=UPI0012A51F6A|nr:uncharacterized protein BDW43DRAFT_290468 [Aspergillus alliaceus]KAB8228629.1 hypothetical protein BDW43DRAFT_290468 [Aspergillus alliaceus]
MSETSSKLATDNPSGSPSERQNDPVTQAENSTTGDRTETQTQTQTDRPREETREGKQEKGKEREESEEVNKGYISEGEEGQEEEEEEASAPPLPDEKVPPPLPNEAPPREDDGWEPVWDANVGSYYFYNRLTGVSQWENPRVPDAAAAGPPGVEASASPTEKAASVLGSYNPAIHGDYDPTAPYAQQYEQPPTEATPAGAPGVDQYTAAGAFNRFTGRWQADSQNPEQHNDHNKSYRQMNAFFDVDAAANSHDGRSLRAERSAKKLTKKELKMFKEKRREKKEEKRRAWLRD